jgi:hypothetical protein
VKPIATLRVSQVAARYGEHAPTAAVCCNACRTVETRQKLEREDVLLLRKRGIVPLAIADELRIGLRRVVALLEEAGEEIPGYLTTWNEPPREPKPCRHCGATQG